MPKIISLPDGREAEFPDNMDNSAIESVLQKQFAPEGVASKGTGALSASAISYGGTDSPGVLKQALGGAKHAWDRAAAGAAHLFGDESLDPLVEQGKAFVKETGPVSSVGQFAGDVALTAPVAAALPAALFPQVVGNAAWNATISPEDRGTAAAFGAAGGSAPAALSGAMKLLGKGASHVLGVTTGAGGEAVQQAFKGAPGFVENMRGAAPASDIVETARQGVAAMRQSMGEAYRSNKQLWAAGQQPLNFSDVGSAFVKMRDSLQHNGQWKIGPAEQRTVQEIQEVLTEFAANRANHTTEGFDALKQRLSAIYPESPMHSQAQRAVTTMTNAVKDSIIKQNPAYADAMKDYWVRSAQLSEIERSLSLNKKATIDTALRKLQSLVRNNANTNYGQRLASADALSEAGADVLPAVAGQAMNSWAPRGLQAAISGGAGSVGLASGVLNLPGAAAAASVQSPRLVGEAAHAAGRIYRNPSIEAFLRALRRTAPAAVRQGQGE